VLEVFRHREELGGYRVTKAPNILRHFTARLEPVPVAVSAG
jgi:tryptophanase